MSSAWMTSVAELVDVSEGSSHAEDQRGLLSSTDVTAVTITLADGTQVVAGEQGRSMLSFVLDELNVGHAIHIESAEQLMSPDDAATSLHVTRQTIYRWQDAGILPCVLRGKTRAVPAPAVAQLSLERDSRKAAADELATRASAMDGETTSRAALFAATQEAAAIGTPAKAHSAWSRRRASAVAQAAARAREAFATAQPATVERPPAGGRGADSDADHGLARQLPHG